MDKLKPCPFCGGEAIVERYADGEGNIVVDHNDGCFAEFVNVYDMEEADLQEAIEAWNTRAERTCKNIGAETGD